MNRSIALFLGIALVLALPYPAAAQVRFVTGDLLAHEETEAIAAGDFDGDGRRDLAILDYQHRVTLQLQTSDGAFTATTLAPAGFEPWADGRTPLFAAGDFNEDGRDDLVFAGDGGWRMLLSQPGGAWVVRSPPPNRHQGVATPLVSDIDRDGHLDLVQAQQIESYPGSGHLIGSALHLYFGDGTGALAPRGVIDAGRDNFRGVLAGHFNADPFVDIATAEGGAYQGNAINLVVRYGFGGSAFSAPVRFADHASGLAAGDFNGDGRTDLVTGGLPGLDDVRLKQYQQLPGGTLAAPRSLPMVGSLRALHRLDADGDGRDDLVAFTDMVPAGSFPSWLLSFQQRDGQLQMPEQVTIGGYSSILPPDGRSLAVGDFDGDGFEDVAEAVFDGIRLHLARPHVPSGNGTPPLAPTITGVESEEGSRTATLTVARPGGDGGSPILGYRVITTPAGPYLPPVTAPPGTGTFTVQMNDLPEGTTYQVQVQAFNAAGDGAPSPAVPVTAIPLRTLRIEEYVELPEGDDGPVVHNVPARLTWPAGPGGVRFDVQSMTTSAGGAEPGVHFEEVSLQGVFIPEGQSEALIPVTIIGNRIPDTNRQFTLRVDNVTGAGGSGLISWVRIRTEEFAPGPPMLYGLFGEVVEGNAGQKLVPFRFAFDRPLEGPVVVGVSTDERPEMNFLALPPADYDASPIPNFTVPAGATGATIHIPVNGDTIEEPDEFIAILFFVVSGPATIAPNGGNYAINIVWDDDRTHPPLAARAERIILSQNRAVQFSVLTNDVFTEYRTGLPQTAFTGPDVGELHFIQNDFNVVADEELIFRPVPGFLGVHRQPYWLCERPFYSRRCAESEIELVVRPIPEPAVTLEVPGAAGHRDIEIDGLQAMPGVQFEASALVRPFRHDIVLDGDTDPNSPWDDTAGTDVSAHVLPVPDDGRPRSWRVLVDASTQGAGDVDLYLGVDTDSDGRADFAELACTAAMVPSGESCELEIEQPGNAAVSYWVMLHNRGTGSLPARAEIAAVRLDATNDGSLVATGPGQLREGEHFALRLAWNDASLLPGERRVGYLRVRSTGDDPGGLVPVRVTRASTPGPDAPIALANARPRTLALPAASAHRRVLVDVPEGASTLAVQTRSTDPVDLYLVPAGPGSSPRIVDAPPVTAAVAASVRAGGDEDAVVYAPAPGRWYAVVDNTGNAPASVEITATITAAAPIVRSGSYFNPARGGHGLVLYPAADQWAGLWYTYFQDGTPTWLYLQAPAPGADGLWTAPLYRTAWNGSAQHVVQVGEATVTPTGPDAFRFTWTLDGETGSEPLVSLGRGCPSLAGAPLDASSHWFDPARAGTGYSVQLWPDYEMHLAFVYDAQGKPRFLIAEGPGFGGADRVLDLEQLQGFCPLCDRAGAPARRTVGTFSRLFGNEMMRVDIDGLYVPALPGWWSAVDAARPLGGPGTTQGCLP
ncbi:FG-GAP-like repeat-containing protein [Arenimonas aestuarii]